MANNDLNNHFLTSLVLATVYSSRSIFCAKFIVFNSSCTMFFCSLYVWCAQFSCIVRLWIVQFAELAFPGTIQMLLLQLFCFTHYWDFFLHIFSLSAELLLVNIQRKLEICDRASVFNFRVHLCRKCLATFNKFNKKSLKLPFNKFLPVLLILKKNPWLSAEWILFFIYDCFENLKSPASSYFQNRERRHCFLHTAVKNTYCLLIWNYCTSVRLFQHRCY